MDLALDATMACNGLGWIHFNAGRTQEAEMWYHDALDRSQRCGSAYEAARAQLGLGNVAMAEDRKNDAQRYWTLADGCGIPLNPAILGELRFRLDMGISSIAGDGARRG